MNANKRQPVLRRLAAFGTGIERLLILVAGAGLILMMLQISVDVAARNIIGKGVPGTSLLVANYFMIIVGFLPLALAEREGAHIRVELISRALSARQNLWLGRFTHAFSLSVCLFLLWHTLKEAWRRFDVGTVVVELDVPVPVWPAYFAVPIGLGWFAAEILGSAIAAERSRAGAPAEEGPHGN